MVEGGKEALPQVHRYERVSTSTSRGAGKRAVRWREEIPVVCPFPHLKEQERMEVCWRKDVQKLFPRNIGLRECPHPCLKEQERRGVRWREEELEVCPFLH